MRLRMTYNYQCPHCDKPCDSKNDEYTVTKRRTKQYFHKKCYEANRIKK